MTKRQRRANGTGSILRRADGNGWEARLRLPDGKRLTKKAATQREARSILAGWKKRYVDLAAEAAAPEPHPAAGGSDTAALLAALQRHLQRETVGGRLRPKTASDMLSQARNHAARVLADTDICADPRAAAARLDAVLASEGLGHPTRRHAALALRRMLRAGAEEGLVGAEAEQAVPVPRDNGEAPQGATPSTEQMRAILGGIASDADADPRALLVLLGALTGARRGELCGAKWSDFTLSGGWTVRRSVSIKGVHATKTGRIRTVPLAPAVLEALERARGSASSQWVAPDAADPSQPIHPENFSAYYRRTAEAHGAPGGLHSLRRYAATKMLEHTDIDAAALLLGHRDLSTTRRYLTARDKRVRDGVLAIADALAA